MEIVNDKNQKTEEKKKAIMQEYGALASQLGQATYQMHILTMDKEGYIKRMKDLSASYNFLKKKEEKLKAGMTDAAAEEAAKAEETQEPITTTQEHTNG